MKTRLTKLISLMLVFAFLCSCISVFSFAADSSAALNTESDQTEGEGTGTTTSTAPEKLELLLYRNYSEGWPLTNGMTWTPQGNTVELDYELDYTFNYNYFARFTQTSSTSGYLNYTVPSTNEENFFVEFDIMTDDICTFNKMGIMYVQTGSSSSGGAAQMYMFRIANGYILAPAEGEVMKADDGNNAKFTNFIPISSDWTHLGAKFVYTNPGEDQGIDITLIGRTKDGTEVTRSFRYLLKAGHEDQRLPMYVRFGCVTSSVDLYGSTFCMDNVYIYRGVEDFTEILPEWGLGYGSSVNKDAAKTEEILGGYTGENESIDDYINNGVIMKVGVDYCLKGGERAPILANGNGEAYGHPVKIDGVVYAPLFALLEVMNLPYFVHEDGLSIDITTGQSVAYITTGRSTATVDGERIELTAAPAIYTYDSGDSALLIALEDIEVLFQGWYLTYDEMGLIAVAEKDNLFNRDNNLSYMLELVRNFVFDYDGVDDIYGDIESVSGQQHPYLVIDGDEFDLMSEMYEEYLAYAAAVEEAKANNQEIPAKPENYLYMQMIARFMDAGIRGYKTYAKPTKEATELTEAEYESYVGLINDKDIFTLDIYGGYSLIQPNLIPEEQRTVYLMENGEYVLDEDGNKIVSSIYGFDQFGYDAAGGRMNVQTRIEHMRYMAFVYQITGNLDYIRCAYDAFMRLGEWVTWGTGHFLSIGDGGAAAGMFFDWAYDGIEKLGGEICPVTGEPYNVDAVRQIIYDKVVYESYRVEECRLGRMKWQPYDMPVAKGYTDGTDYHDRDNNWSAVCTSGVGIATISLLDGTESAEIKNMSLHVLSTDFYYLTKGGINMYAPDGAYHEGPSYWAYGTNNLFEYCMVLDTVCGTNYGIMEGVGIQETVYFALYDEGNDNVYFNFNDCGIGGQDTSAFFYVGQYYGDSTLMKVHLNQLEQGLKSPKIFDLYWYPLNGIEEGENTSGLDYYAEQIDIFTTRASWETGSLFAGMIGGKNNTSHGQIDAGTFVYYNKGVSWFIDIGTENYNAVGFWGGSTRYRYYKMKPEGHNTVAITSEVAKLKFGQDLNGYAKAYEWELDGEHGAYVKYDMTNTLNGVANFWKRGMMLTNDRKTTIVQDEIAFEKITNAYWFAHFNMEEIESYRMSEDGKTVYLFARTNNGLQTLRVSLLSSDRNLKFEVWDTYTFVHSASDDPEAVHHLNYNDLYYTYKRDELAATNSALGENARDKYKKLVIRAEEVLQFNCAVVIEVIDTNNEVELGYEWTPMDGNLIKAPWATYADTRDGAFDNGAGSTETENRKSYAIGKINACINKLKPMMEGEELTNALINNLDEYYLLMADLAYLFNYYKDSLNGYQEKINTYNESLEAFNAYFFGVREVTDTADKILSGFIGVNV